MDKQKIVAFIEEHLATGAISKEDLALLVKSYTAPTSPASMPNSKIENTSYKKGLSENIINVFYGIGAIIALGGIAILVSQNWAEIGFPSRVLATLGISLLTYTGAFLLSKPAQKVISQVMFTISSVLAPLGVFVILDKANITFAWPHTFFTWLALCVIFGYALWISKKNILILITIGFASCAYYSLVLKIIAFNYDWHILKWAGIILGLSYIFIAHGYKKISTAANDSDKKERLAIKNTLFGFGTLSILGSGIFIGGFFDMIFITFIFAAFYGSVYLKSRLILTLGALFLIAHIIKLTSKYFVNSVGWSIGLIIVGFLIIGVGYMTYSLNKKYITVR